MPSHLVAVLHSLPLGDGTRTLQRIQVARDALGCASHSIANLYPVPLADVNALSGHAGHDFWMNGRRDIAEALAKSNTTDVLLGYGVQLPTGSQRAPYRAQVEWLHNEVAARDVRVWTFGDRPSHPSRWQRVSHRHRPGASISDVASDLLTPLALGG